MTFNFLYVSVFFFAMVMQEQKCREAMLHSATSAMEFFITHWFPQDTEFNESCVAEGCPALKNISLCPNQFKIEALRDVNEILNKCMRGPICGIIVDRRALKSSVVFSMEEFLPGLEIEGNSTVFPDNCDIFNISNIQLQMSSNEMQRLPLQVTMAIHDFRFYARFKMDLRVENLLGTTLTASLNESSFDAGIQFISTLLVNRTRNGANVDIRLVNPIVRAHDVFCGTDMPSGFPDIRSFITSNSQINFEKSSIAKAMGNFLEKLYRAAAQVASNNCKPLN